MRAKVEKQIVKKERKEQLHTSDDQSVERDQIRRRQKDWQRAAVLQRVGGDKRNHRKERDISEQIALGVQTASSTGVQYDQRLFIMSASFGRSLSDDEAYYVYDQPWNCSTAIVSQISKLTKTTKNNFYNTEALINASKRFEQERGFKGADRVAPRKDPVQFQCDEDPFGLSDFLKDVRNDRARSSAPSANQSSNSSSKRGNADDREERTSEKRHKK